MDGALAGVSREQRGEPIVERQHTVQLGLLPPLFDQLCYPLRLLGRQVVALGEVLVDVVELPAVVVV